MKIFKFGGTSVGQPERMKKVAQLVNTPEKKIVVLSALSGTTNALVEICQLAHAGHKAQAGEKITELEKHHQQFAQTLLPETNAATEEMIHQHFMLIRAVAQAENFGEKEEKIVLAQGELLSTHFFQAYTQSLGMKTLLVPALDFMKINEEAEPAIDYIAEHLQHFLDRHPEVPIFITQGYICRNEKGDIDNLQRGGSDYTASLIGAALRAEEVQIWTDIDGMHNNDPRFVKNTSPIDELSFDEAAELAYFGAKILHPASIHPAQLYNIPVRLLNTMKPEAKGTLISTNTSQSTVIKSIAAKDDIIAIKIKSSRMLMAYGFLRKVFEVFEKYKTPIDMITTSEVAVSLTIDDPSYLENIVEDLKPYGTLEVDRDQTIICVVGNFVSENNGTASNVFNALRDVPIRMISFGGSKHNISMLVHTEHKNKALNLLSQGLFNVKV